MVDFNDIQPWLFQVKPMPGESLSHFLGRFRRKNGWTPAELAKAAGFGGAIISRWEKFRFNPPPSPTYLAALAVVVGVELERMVEMLPPLGITMKLEPIRLCGACYAESPCHQIAWQLQTANSCQKHRLSLLSECPICKARFKMPALWVNGHCHKCFTSFVAMAESQKVVINSFGGSVKGDRA
jgi:transcriptional regulator with XRE-family HTH domain